jgi:DNA-binding NtrC family response regulator
MMASAETNYEIDDIERTTIANVLNGCRGNKTKAARRLGLSRTQLHMRIRLARCDRERASV